MPTADQLSTTADLITAGGVAVGALAAGAWTLHQTRRQEPHLPRINPSLMAELIPTDEGDCSTFTATVEHAAGRRLHIRQGSDRTPRVCVHRLEALDGRVKRERIDELAVMTEQSVMANGETVRHCGALGVWPRTPATFGYDIEFTFTGSEHKKDHKKAWTFTENVVALVDKVPPD